MSNHPNAWTAAGAGWICAALIYLLGLFGVTVPDPPLEVAVGVGGMFSALALFVGRKGLKGLAARLWRGREE